MTSAQILLNDLRAAKAPGFMMRKAQSGQYNDYESDSSHPIMDLVRDATVYDLHDIVVQAKNGKYDGTKAESDAWMEREGKDLFKELGE